MDAKTLANIKKRVTCCDNERAVIWPSGDIIAIGGPDDIELVSRANLLIRSKEFLEERARAYEVLKKKEKKGVQPWFNKTWQDFCYGWQIRGFWDGNAAKLHLNISRGAEIFIKDQSGEISSIPFDSVMMPGRGLVFPYRSTRWPDNICKDPNFIYLKLTRHTGIKDVVRMWRVIEVLKAEVWKVSERKKRTFGRDLMLFDLKHETQYGPLSYGQLARNQKMSKAKVQMACKRILESISHLRPPQL